MTYTKKDLQIVISHGQSLSVGASANNPISVKPLFPGEVLGLGASALGEPTFVDLVATNKEAPIVSMLNTIAENFKLGGQEAPILAGAMTGSPGKPLIALYLSSSDQREDVARGLETTTPGAFFYTKGGKAGDFDIYLNSGGTATNVLSTDYEPNLFDPVEQSLRQFKVLADANGLEITDKIIFSFIHGSADSHGRAGVSYAEQLKMLSAKVDTMAESIFQKEMTTVSIINQSRSPYPSVQQFDYVDQTKSSYMGALAFPYQADYSSDLNWRTGEILGRENTHLNELGYFLLGQDTGNVIYDVLAGSKSEDDFLKIRDVAVQGDTLIVRFSGLKGKLVQDESGFDPNFTGDPPKNFGFQVSGNSKFSIISAQITADDQVTLKLNKPLSSSLTLDLGISPGFGATTLRDSVSRDVNNFLEISQLQGVEIKNFVPSESIELSFASGTIGNDFLMGTTMDDNIYGKAGNDTISGMNGNDALFGNLGEDSIRGDQGNDTIDGGMGSDTIDGGIGNDVFIIRNAEGSLDSFNGGAGIDTIRVDTASLVVTLTNLQPVDVEIFEGSGKIIQGTKGDNVLDFSTFTTVTGVAAINGLAGNDLIKGTSLADLIDGGSGNDSLFGNGGDDVFIIRNADASLDTFNGGAGIDTIRVDTASLVVTLTNLQPVDVEVFDGAGKIVQGTRGNNVLDFSTFTTVTGVAAINGLAGNDRITGSQLADRIDGGEGNDTIIGGAGKDSLTGGAGADSFVFNFAAAASNIDRITDFESGSDRLVFDNTVFVKLAGVSGAELSADQFHLGPNALDANDYLIYDQTVGKLYYDADGNGTGSKILLADFTGLPTLQFSDVHIL